MMTLADRIEGALTLSAPLMAPEISRHVHARDVDVRDALRLDGRFVAVRLPGRSQKAVGWMLQADSREARDEWGRVA